jgi:hypothetical protein
MANGLYMPVPYAFATCYPHAFHIDKTFRLNPYGGHITMANGLHVSLPYEFATCHPHAFHIDKTVRLNPYGDHITMANGSRVTVSYDFVTGYSYVFYMDKASQIKTTLLPYDNVSGGVVTPIPTSLTPSLSSYDLRNLSRRTVIDRVYSDFRC